MANKRLYPNDSARRSTEHTDKLCFRTMKDKFHGKKQALSAAGKNKKMFGREYFVYKCPFCNWHHLTTQEQKGHDNGGS